MVYFRSHQLTVTKAPAVGSAKAASRVLILVALCLGALIPGFVLAGQSGTGVLLPDGTEFVSWERPQQFTKTYFVANENPKASDANSGTEDQPFLTINRAAQVLQPGERVVIQSGIYRERVNPARGGIGPDKMISYESAPGAHVIVKGSIVVKSGWEPSTGFRLGEPAAVSAKIKVYRRHIDDIDFHGYNPFGMVNIMQDRVYLNPKPGELRRHLLRRGMIFVDGKRLEQVELYQELAAHDGAFWCEHDGLTLHVRLPADGDPAQHEMELVIHEQVFAPRLPGLNYLRVKGITFEHAANAFPVPQYGLLSTTRGHHWIIEDCVIQHANAVGLDMGMQDWDLEGPPLIGYSIVRRNHIVDVGVLGIAGMAVQNTLIESNLIENVGWQDVELTWEAGGIKLHTAKNCLLRNNVIRHLIHCGGIWLDYLNKNTRVTGNVIGDTLETLRGGIYIEASHEANMFDHNIIWKATEGQGGSANNYPSHGGWGITLDGTDETVIAHNLIGLTQDAAIKIRTTEGRIVAGRGGTSRQNRVINNIFFQCGKAIDFPHQENFADGNLYGRDPGKVHDENQALGRGLNWIETPEVLRLDLDAWQGYLGFDKNGAYADLAIDVDLDALTMTWSAIGNLPRVTAERPFQRDLLGEAAGEYRHPGPLLNLTASPVKISIDPRH